MRSWIDRRATGAGRSSGWRALALGACVASLMAGLLGCGSATSRTVTGGDDAHPAARTGAGVRAAKQAVAHARAPLARFAGPSMSPGPVPRGKTLVTIAGEPAPLPLRAAKSVIAPAQAVGWNARAVVTSGGTPADWGAAIDRAIAGGADAIAMAAIQPALVRAPLERARRAGIPVVSIAACDPHPPPGVSEVHADYAAEGRMLARWVQQASPGGAQILMLHSPEFLCLRAATSGFQAGIAAAGSAFNVVADAGSPASDISGAAGARRLAAMLRRFPQAKYFFVMSESWAGVLTQAEQMTGRGEVTGLGADSDFFLPRIRQGARFVSAAPDTEELGWYGVDALIRRLNRRPAVRYRIPFQLVDAANAAATQGEGITASFDYPSAWLRLWGARG